MVASLCFSITTLQRQQSRSSYFVIIFPIARTYKARTTGSGCCCVSCFAHWRVKYFYSLVSYYPKPKYSHVIVCNPLFCSPPQTGF